MPEPRMDERLVWCDECRAFAPTTVGRFNWTCPSCHAPIDTLRCTRCGYVWRPRGRAMPKACPRCNSYLYAVRPIRSDMFRRRLRAR